MLAGKYAHDSVPINAIDEMMTLSKNTLNLFKINPHHKFNSIKRIDNYLNTK